MIIKHQGWVWDIVFSADSLYLISGSSDHSAKLWDVRTGEVLRNYIGHNLTVSSVCLNDSVS
jgi:G protein beta subunit-like protein